MTASNVRRLTLLTRNHASAPGAINSVTSACAIPFGERMKSAAPLRIAASGMAKTAAVSLSWANTVPPARTISHAPLAPSCRFPVSTIPIAFGPKLRGRRKQWVGRGSQSSLRRKMKSEPSIYSRLHVLRCNVDNPTAHIVPVFDPLYRQFADFPQQVPKYALVNGGGRQVLNEH